MNPQARWLVLLGALNGFLAVAFGAFGAHALRNGIADNLFNAFQTAVQYHQIHALGLLAIGLLARHQRCSWLSASGWLMLAGILMFSGSLYLLALTDMHTLGMVTPFGGTALLLSWLLLGIAALRRPTAGPQP